MEVDKLFKSLTYVPKIWTALSYPLLVLVSLILFFGRNVEPIRIGSFLEVMPDFYSHISNFSLSFILYISIGYVGIMFGLTVKNITIIGIGIVSVNLIIEFLLPFLNTPDTSDALFGTIGVILGFAFLFLSKNYGLKKNEL
ncbi:hypothetical protein [Pareuzebyella sediminis]|uniref:hypothetical protein n=1 Tax=Pareuzebyella sediminis TaxID=2607998 RepID=UPI0011EE5D4A|nr:hypothetical protein [Pareuzebyella sediminis]